MTLTSVVGTFETCRMHRAMSEFEVQTGKHMLALSSSQFDPEQIFATGNVSRNAAGGLPPGRRNSSLISRGIAATRRWRQRAVTAQSLIRPESLSKIGASSSTRLLNEDRLCMRSRNARRRGQRLRAGATPAYRKFTWAFAIAISAIVRRSPTKNSPSPSSRSR
jgi:hypothetical protein